MTKLNNNQQPSTKLLDNLITYEQLSKWIQVPIATIRDWVYKREIPFKKLGRHIRFDPSEVRSWIDERSVYGSYTKQG